MTPADLDPLLRPRCVAVVGASDDPGKVGGRPIAFLRQFGFGGTVLPVNANRPTVQGLPAFADVASLPETPDVAVVVVPGEAALVAVEECAARGVGAAIVMASGFGEASGDGLRLQSRMVDAARGAGMRLVGPNCQGLTNFANGSVLSFSTMYLEVPPMDGPVAIVSQSGSMSQVPYAVLRSRGLGVRYCHATGNDADVTAPEIAVTVAADPEIGVLLLYLETIRETGWLAELGRVAAERDLPVVALKAGRTREGQRAAASHTGALANEDRVVDAFLERVGIHRARDLPDLLLAVELHLTGHRPRGRRVAVVSNSGASCVQVADAAEASGLELAVLRDDTVRDVAAVLPAFATATNPVDVTAGLLGNSHLFSDVLTPLGRDGGVDAVVVALPVAGRGYDVDAFAADTAAFAATAAPTVVVAVNPPVVDRFRRAGLPVFATETEAVGALAQWATCADTAAAARRDPFRPRVLEGRAAFAGVALDELDSLAVVAAAGVPVVEHRLCRTPAEAVDALGAFGGRVVLKGCTAALAHKSDAGLVVVDLRDERSVALAFGDITERLSEIDPAARGIVAAAMAPGRHELLLGARVDDIFGPIVLVGAGGAYVEVLGDLQVLLAPFDADAVRRAIGRLRIAPLLGGVRGERPADLDAFAAAATAVGRLVADPASGVVELDVNPVIVADTGKGCLAVDAMVRRRP